jgi:hypothetical protein
MELFADGDPELLEHVLRDDSINYRPGRGLLIRNLF